MIRYIDAQGETIEEMREHARKSDLAGEGDMKLVWVNEGDLSIHIFNSVFARSKEEGHICTLNAAMDGTCFICGKQIQ